ncbi:hypothetical protein GBAR_LOCUS20747 [Geodia barretti]|uniref:Uncharacterized protein n=1 Tax=Geodia barretti TaxID=519541 RepID=A0AA35SXH5_GEOBA|nr:hypothetical protein GBAR_LOCUS20747 [Geodia barretti]
MLTIISMLHHWKTKELYKAYIPYNKPKHNIILLELYIIKVTNILGQSCSGAPLVTITFLSLRIIVHSFLFTLTLLICLSWDSFLLICHYFFI